MSKHSRGTSGHPMGTSEHPRGMSGHPRGMSGHPSGMSGHPRGMSEHPSGMSGHPRGMSEHPRGMSEHPRGMSEHPSGMSGHPSGMSGHPRGMSEYSRCMSEGTVCLYLHRRIPAGGRQRRLHSDSRIDQWSKRTARYPHCRSGLDLLFLHGFCGSVGHSLENSLPGSGTLGTGSSNTIIHCPSQVCAGHTNTQIVSIYINTISRKVCV